MAGRTSLALGMALLALRPSSVAGQTGFLPPEVEEAASIARRAAQAALEGRPQLLEATLDREGLLRRALPGAVLPALTPLQRRKVESRLVGVIRDTLILPSSARPEVVTTEIRQQQPILSVGLLLTSGPQRLKTRWDMVRRIGEWRIADVQFVDLGVSLAGRAVESLGHSPLRRRDPAREARQALWPRALGFLAVAITVLAFGRRVSGGKRSTLWIAASAPALLFAVDGFLSVRRALTEPYALLMPADREPADQWAARAAAAAHRGNVTLARDCWRRAIEAGARPQPIEYRLALIAEGQNDAAGAERHFRRALLGPQPAPGAHAGLALLSMNAEHFDEALREWESYIATTGPDAESSSSLATCLLYLGHDQDADEHMRRAVSLWPDNPVALSTAARVAAYRGDTQRAISHLTELQRQRPLDRQSLREDPAFQPISDDPVWKSFLEGIPAVSSGSAKPFSKKP